MKKLTLLAFLIGSLSVCAQTTIPVKDTAFVTKITTGPSKYGIYHHYDYMFGFAKYRAWANQYQGKWYSNYPYTVVLSYNKHIIKLYRHGFFIYAFTDGPSSYQWYNKNMIVPRDTIAYNKTWHITDSVKRKGKLFYYCNSNGITTWLIKK